MGQKPIARYAIAVLATGLALAVRVALEPTIGNRANFITIFPTVVAIAWRLGLGPALAALATGALGSTSFLLEPRHSLGIATLDDQIALGAFLLTGLFTALLAEAARAGRRRAEASAELALRRQHQLESVTDNTSVLLTQCNRDLRYVFVNRACEQFLGLPRDEIVGREIRAVLGDAAFEAIRSHVEKVLQGEVAEFETELPYAHAGTRFVHVRYVPDRGPGGDVCGWFASVTDVTDQKQAERVLREADRRKDEFLATLGHELRNPLAPIAQRACRCCRPRATPDPERRGRARHDRAPGAAARAADRRPARRQPHHPRQDRSCAASGSSYPWS